jgi:phage terminase Nu1 subunit (DNA packaging protein)
MKYDPVEVTAASLCRLLGVTRNTLSDLSKRGIVVKGEKRGSYLLQPSVTGYCQHLRGQGVGTDDEGVSATQARHVQLHSDEMPVASDEKLWSTKLWNFRKRLFRISNRDSRSFQIYVKNHRWNTVYLK